MLLNLASLISTFHIEINKPIIFFFNFAPVANYSFRVPFLYS